MLVVVVVVVVVGRGGLGGRLEGGWWERERKERRCWKAEGVDAGVLVRLWVGGRGNGIGIVVGYRAF